MTGTCAGLCNMHACICKQGAQKQVSLSHQNQTNKLIAFLIAWGEKKMGSQLWLWLRMVLAPCLLQYWQQKLVELDARWDHVQPGVQSGASRHISDCSRQRTGKNIAQKKLVFVNMKENLSSSPTFLVIIFCSSGEQSGLIFYCCCCPIHWNPKDSMVKQLIFNRLFDHL